MNSILENALTGEPVTVTLLTRMKVGDAEVTRRWEYALAYPMQAVILYKQETAKLDRARSAARLAQGGAKLTREEKRELRNRRKAILKEFPSKAMDDWTSDDVEETETLLRDATAITCTLDEDAGTGDSLYEVRNWRKIGSDDFERLLLALWVGLHRFSTQHSALSTQPKPNQTFASPLSLQDLAEMNFPDAELAGIVESINKALSRSLIAPRHPDDEEPVPNAPAPVETMPPAETPTGVEMEQRAAMMADTEMPSPMQPLSTSTT